MWRSLKYYELSEVIRQANADFAAVLTKIGNGETLTECQQNLIEKRFFTEVASNELCASGTLFSKIKMFKIIIAR